MSGLVTLHSQRPRASDADNIPAIFKYLVVCLAFMDPVRNAIVSAFIREKYVYLPIVNIITSVSR